MNKTLIRIKDKETGLESGEVSLADIIYEQSNIEFVFPNEETLPYNDFLFYQDNYEVIVRIKNDKK